MVLTDTNGEGHPLEVPIGDGVPIDRFIMLTCEVGVKEKSTVMRISVNGKRVRNVELPFRLDLGTLNVPGGVIGADLEGLHGAQFDDVETGLNSATLSNDELAQYACYARQLPKTAKKLSYVRFNGNQWMRAQSTTFGHADMKQTDPAHQPTFYNFTEDDKRDWFKDDC
jgi:hypothetical protein